MEERSYLEKIATDIWRATGELGAYPGNEATLWLGYAVLCLVKGKETTSEDVHHAWTAWALVNYPFIHRSTVPFDQLSESVQKYDDEYRDAIHKVAQ